MGIKKAQQNIASILLLSSTVYRYLLAGANMAKLFGMAKKPRIFVKNNFNMKIQIKLPDESKMETFMYLLMIVSVSLLCIGIFFMGLAALLKQLI